jgi:hypothetical protein
MSIERNGEEQMVRKRRIMLVATIEPSRATVDAILSDASVGAGEGTEVLVVVPAVRQSRLEWLTNDEDRARREASDVAEQVAADVPGDVTAAEVGDSDPLLAIRDALREFAASEIILVTPPEQDASWLDAAAANGIETEGTVDGIPVTHVRLPPADARGLTSESSR